MVLLAGCLEFPSVRCSDPSECGEGETCELTTGACRPLPAADAAPADAAPADAALADAAPADAREPTPRRCSTPRRATTPRAGRRRGALTP
ncbi:MAG: hypothetical protein H6704_24400 [Myxococcales bacterium]|nr:hypothetical protein [Myxococcales bacterium]